MQLTRQLQRVKDKYAPDVSVTQFVKMVNAKALGLQNESQFFEPITLAIHVGKRPRDVMAIKVPVHGNQEGWYDVCRARLGKTLSIDAPLELKTITGRPIRNMTPQELTSAGKLHLYVNGKRFVKERMPDNIPVEYNQRKYLTLAKWVNDNVCNSEALTQTLANALVNKNIYEINAAILPGKEIEQKIQAHLRESAPKSNWHEFVRVMHSNSPTHMSEEASESVLRLISSNMLTYIQRVVGANATKIAQHLSAKETQRAIEEVKKLGGAPLILAVNGNASSSSSADLMHATHEHGFNMYLNVAKEALDVPLVMNTVFDTLYSRPLAIGTCSWDENNDPKQIVNFNKKKKKKTSSSSSSGPAAPIVSTTTSTKTPSSNKGPLTNLMQKTKAKRSGKKNVEEEEEEEEEQQSVPSDSEDEKEPTPKRKGNRKSDDEPEIQRGFAVEPGFPGEGVAPYNPALLNSVAEDVSKFENAAFFIEHLDAVFLQLQSILREPDNNLRRRLEDVIRYGVANADTGRFELNRRYLGGIIGIKTLPPDTPTTNDIEAKLRELKAQKKTQLSFSFIETLYKEIQKSKTATTTRNNNNVVSKENDPSRLRQLLAKAQEAASAVKGLFASAVNAYRQYRLTSDDELERFNAQLTELITNTTNRANKEAEVERLSQQINTITAQQSGTSEESSNKQKNREFAAFIERYYLSKHPKTLKTWENLLESASVVGDNSTFIQELRTIVLAKTTTLYKYGVPDGRNAACILLMAACGVNLNFDRFYPPQRKEEPSESDSQYFLRIIDRTFAMRDNVANEASPDSMNATVIYEMLKLIEKMHRQFQQMARYLLDIARQDSSKAQQYKKDFDKLSKDNRDYLRERKFGFVKKLKLSDFNPSRLPAIEYMAKIWEVPIDNNARKSEGYAFNLWKEIALRAITGVPISEGSNTRVVYESAPFEQKKKKNAEDDDENTEEVAINNHHPWNAQLQTMIASGNVYPSYCNALLARQQLSEDAPYNGDLRETYQMFHLLSGAHISPPGRIMNRKDSPSSSPRRRSRKTDSWKKTNSQFSEDSSLPETMTIEAFIASQQQQQPEKKKEVSSSLPETMTIEAFIASQQQQQQQPEKKKEVSSSLPETMTIEAFIAAQREPPFPEPKRFADVKPFEHVKAEKVAAMKDRMVISSSSSASSKKTTSSKTKLVSVGQAFANFK
jgi:hypothetical protein